MNRLMRMPNPRPAPQRVLTAAASTSGEPTGDALRVVLDPPPSNASTVGCDQAVFTSIRSPTGEGYRVVAHSAGVTHDEKAEITRRAPSHGSLAGESPHALGMLAFKLAGGRYAVAHCVFAGKEHTARGGDRVWSHFAILDPAAYRALGNNPVRAQRALASVIAPGAAIDRLDALALPAWDQSDLPQHVTTTGDCGAFIQLLDACLRGGCWALAGMRQPARTLEWAFDLMPLAPRANLSLSYGLAFCLGRGLNLTAVDSVRTGVERMIRGHDVHLRNVAATGNELLPAFAPWYELVRNGTPAQRWRRISRFAARIDGALDADRLARVARLSLDLDAALSATDETKTALRETYAGFTPQGELEGELLAQLQEAVAPPPEPQDEQNEFASDAVVIKNGS